MHAQLGDQLVGVVEHRRAGQGQAQAVVGDARPPAGAPPGCAWPGGSCSSGTRRSPAPAAPRRAERLAVGGDDLVVDDHDVGGRRDAAAAARPRRPTRWGSQLARLALPVELQRGRADDDRRVGAVGLERGQRLDRLAQPLLVGQEGPPGLEDVADPGPLEGLRARRRATAATSGIGGALVARERADRRRRLLVLGAQAGEQLGRPRRVTSTAVEGDERVEGRRDPRVRGDRPAGRARAGRRTPRPTSRVPQDLEPQAQAVDPVGEDQPRRRRDRRRARPRPGSARRPRRGGPSAARAAAAAAAP